MAERRHERVSGGDRQGGSPPAPPGGTRGMAPARRPQAAREGARTRAHPGTVPPRRLGKGVGDGRTDRRPVRSGPQADPRHHDGRTAPLRAGLGERGVSCPLPGQLPHGHPRAETLGTPPQGGRRRGRQPGLGIHALPRRGLRVSVPEPVHAELYAPEGEPARRRHPAAGKGEPRGKTAGAGPRNGGQDRRDRRRGSGPVRRLAALPQGL